MTLGENPILISIFTIFFVSVNCRHCSSAFEISDEDLAMLRELSPEIGGKTMSLPPPTLCPDCRLRRRQSHVNHVNLYERKCDLSGAQIISNIHPSSPYRVYAQEDWYSDKWDPHAYQRDFDFPRPFFEQWKELFDAVPRPNLMTGYEFDENCDYTNYAGKNKDCYLIFDSDENRDCYFSYSINQCANCVGCYRTRKSELCYECIDCVKCYGSSYLQDCDNCAESMFLKNCTGCKKCLMCSNLKNKEYFIENKQVSKEEFDSFRAMLGSQSVVESARRHERYDVLPAVSPFEALFCLRRLKTQGILHFEQAIHQGGVRETRAEDHRAHAINARMGRILPHGDIVFCLQRDTGSRLLPAHQKGGSCARLAMV